MGLRDRLRELVPGLGTDHTAYRCEECGTSYEARLEPDDEPRCPSCGAGAAAAVPAAG